VGGALRLHEVFETPIDHPLGIERQRVRIHYTGQPPVGHRGDSSIQAGSRQSFDETRLRPVSRPKLYEPMVELVEAPSHASQREAPPPFRRPGVVAQGDQTLNVAPSCLAASSQCIQSSVLGFCLFLLSSSLCGLPPLRFGAAAFFVQPARGRALFAGAPSRLPILNRGCGHPTAAAKLCTQKRIAIVVFDFDFVTEHVDNQILSCGADSHALANADEAL
jgi:hypothetical protein